MWWTFSSYSGSIMDTILSRGFVVQDTVTPLDLKESRNQYPILFISEEKQYVASWNNSKNLVDSSSVVYWEYYDEDRQTFEESIFETFERKLFQERTDLSRIQKYLNLCRILCRCVDLDEAKRIFFQVSTEIESFDLSLLLELLETVCLTTDMVLFIFDWAGMRSLDFLKSLLLLSQIRNHKNFGNLSIYSWISITDLNIISRYFINGHYLSISTLLKYGLQWKFCEAVYSEYCKAMNFNWTGEVHDLSNCDYEESAERSKHRFFLILQTFFTINKRSENPYRMMALRLLWRSIPDAVIGREEMISSLKKFTGLGDESFHICTTAVWWETEHLPGPRSLKHLSRCCVRKQLANNYQLPCDDFKLNIPRCLIPYINLDE